MTRAYVSSSPCLDGLRKLGSKPQRENHATLSSAFAIAAGGKKLSSDSLFWVLFPCFFFVTGYFYTFYGSLSIKKIILVRV